MIDPALQVAQHRAFIAIGPQSVQALFQQVGLRHSAVQRKQFVELLLLARGQMQPARQQQPTFSLYQFPQRPAVGEPGSSATALRFETEVPSAALCCSRQIVLDDLAAAMAGMEAGAGPRAAGDRRSLASGRIQIVLDVALAASDPRGKKMRYQGIARVDLSHGRRESDLGCAAPSWRTENA